MPSIVVITDTDSSLPADLAARHNIRQVPITINFGKETFEAGTEMNDAQLFARVDRENKLPTTAAPSPGKFAEAYRAAFDEGAETILCFCVSGEVSATYSAAMAARDLVPGRDIVVVDSRSLTMAQGFMVLAAAEAAEAGASKEEIIAHATDVGQRTHLYAALSTLKYLAMSGRVGHLAAGMASLLNVRPILTIRNGKLDLLERVRTQGKAWARVIELAVQAAGNRPVERMAIIHVNAADDARAFEERLRANMRCPQEIVLAEVTPGLSVHSGAGMVGVVLVAGR